jgi:hypothetical protein
MGIYYEPTSKKWNVSYEKTDNPTNLRTDYPESYEYTVKTQDRCDSRDVWGNCTAQDRYETRTAPLPDNVAMNAANRTENANNATLNQTNTYKNQAYDTTVATASKTLGGDYTSQRQLIRNIGNVDPALKSTLENQFKTFYQTEKLQTWDANLGAKPPYGQFDAAYYKSQYPDVAQAWANFVANDDLDVTGRYGSEAGFSLYHYTAHGQYENRRANPKENLIAAERYVEEKPTDLELQAVRDLQLGVSPGGSNTEVEELITTEVGEKTKQDVKKFGALTQDVLKQTIEEMKEAKAKESMLDLMGGFSGFSEIMSINKELSNSILGDSGVGGILSFTSKGNPEESLEKSLQNITGVRNNVTYNWQQWFDNELKQRYTKDLELGYTEGQATESVKIEADFARNFIDKYLTPRFNTARSMDEFADYIDVSQEEQNPFQTQDLLNAVNMAADLRARQYLDQIQKTPTRYFDSAFYFNPTGNQAKTDKYQDQVKTVAEDWAAAQGGDPYWKSQAYRFGIDLKGPTAKEDFARMHFEVKGQGKGYDPAEDVLTASKVSNYIQNTILPSVKAEALKQGSVFGLFVTPEEFADEMLTGLDPNDSSKWGEVLEKYGLTDFKGNIDELRQYIIETIRTGSAKDIREQIKYLNEKKQRPTQEILGLTYIERPEDYKTDQPTAQTELYKTFQSAGYQGTEDEFYNTMFPDVDRSEQQILTKAGLGKNLDINKDFFDYSDPFASLGTIESFFSQDEQTPQSTQASSKPTVDNYFRIGFDSDEEEDYKSSTGSKILGEFTSMFKGF